MKINGIASYRSFYLGVCTLGVAFAATAAEPPIITIDAPGAGTGQFQGTGCFAFTDCSVLLNNFGAVTGYYLDANNVYHGFVRSPTGKFTSFQAPGADTTPQRHSSERHQRCGSNCRRVLRCEQRGTWLSTKSRGQVHNL